MEDPDVYKHSIFIFSGDIGVIPTEDEQGEKVEQNEKNKILYK